MIAVSEIQASNTACYVIKLEVMERRTNKQMCRPRKCDAHHLPIQGEKKADIWQLLLLGIASGT